MGIWGWVRLGPGGSDNKEFPCNVGDLGSIPESGRSPGVGNGYPLQYYWASLVAQNSLAKNLPAMWETWILSQGWEDPLDESIATHSSILAWRIPWTEVPGGLQFMGLQRVRHLWVTKHIIGHGYCWPKWCRVVDRSRISQKVGIWDETQRMKRTQLWKNM